ncbi:MAG: PH domain-containing protein [Verrucomicrobiota bacterium]|nr:PH domain-containing protein [Verrucomicrobiota bacterium]
MDFYVYLNGSKRGPFSEERLRSFLADGFLQPQDLASGSGEPDWKPLSEFRRFAAPAATVAPQPLAPQAPASEPVSPPSRTVAIPSPADATAEFRSPHLTNESACFRTSLHWIVFVRYGLLALALFVFAAIPFAVAVQAITGLEIGWFALPFPLFVLVAPVVAFASSELLITERRVLIKTGVVRRQTVEMSLAEIESIAVDQGFFGRMLDYGTMTLRGTGGFAEAFEAVARPIAFRNCVQQLQGAASHMAAPPTRS